MGKPHTKIWTFLPYEMVFNEVDKDGLILPTSYLNDPNNLDVLLSGIIRDFEPNEAISYSSFLNCIAQTCDATETIRLAEREMRLTHLSKGSPKGILFHRDNLLFFIIQMIREGAAGTKSITGSGNLPNTQNYYKSLLLINSKLDRLAGHKEQRILKDYLIRNHPYYYLPEITYIIYSTRIQRYWFIYNDLLNSLKARQKDKVLTGIHEFEKITKIRIADYFYILRGLFHWFINTPLKRNQHPEVEHFKHLGFNYNNINSFYIRKKLFPGKHNHLINLIEAISVDLAAMKKVFSEDSRVEEIHGFYAFFQNIFDHPIFKINEETFSIVDLKFLFDGVCSGLMWHLQRLSHLKIQEIKEQYGYLLEKYFVFLATKLFDNIQITSQVDNQPDALIETKDSIVIFEFTTEYYRISSLYDVGAESFLDDLYRLLFNEGTEDPLARGKKEKGKFYKLNNYFEELKTKNKRILPVLITENYLGDYDLLDRFDNFMLRNIEEKGLDNLKGSKPLIINLDDLEIYWAFCDPNNVDKFIKYTDRWNGASKGEYLYNFSYFVSSQNDGIVKNSEYRNFFDFSRFLSKRKL